MPRSLWSSQNQRACAIQLCKQGSRYCTTQHDIQQNWTHSCQEEGLVLRVSVLPLGRPAETLHSERSRSDLESLDGVRSIELIVLNMRGVWRVTYSRKTVSVRQAREQLRCRYRCRRYTVDAPGSKAK